MKFDYAIGNPPYNADFSISGDNGKFAAPVYNLFMDAAYGIADRVELIHASTSDGRGDTETRKKHIKELLNFFPVIGEDEDSEMVKLDAEKVLSIPRKIRSTEVVNRGFMSNYLFQNISNIFGAPQEVVDIITKFTPVDEPKKQEVKKEDLDRVHVDENGDVKVDEGYVIGLADDIFGDKIYDTVGEQVTQAIDKVAVDNQPKDKALEALQEAFKAQAVKPIVAAATSNYGTEIKASDAKRVEKKLGEDADRLVARTYGDYRIETNQIEKERHEQLAAAAPHEQAKINQEFDQKKAEATEKLKTALNDTVSSFVEDAAKETVRSYETQIEERKKNDVEDTIRDHLRGFARTIPSFLMAYGTEDTTLANFDQIVPDEVFQEVTSITLEQFRFLRDGGDYKDTATGETKHFDGKLFDEVVFDDSIKEFLRLKRELANYFDPANEKDIFDYIPPQRTNQIFTPKATVAKMVSLLEEENPGCFNDPDKTFIDLYMKSGLYITEIFLHCQNTIFVLHGILLTTLTAPHNSARWAVACGPSRFENTWGPRPAFRTAHGPGHLRLSESYTAATPVLCFEYWML